MGMLDHLNEEWDSRPTTSENYWRARAEKAEKKLELYQFVASYAQDVIDFWPTMTMRTIRIMIPKMNALKEALDLVSK